MASDITEAAGSILTSTAAGVPVAPGVHVLPAQGNGLAIETPDGVVLVDVGRGGGQTQKLLATLRTITDAPILAVCLSHGHGGYNFGLADVLAHNAERGDAAPRIIGHRNVVRRFDRYRETSRFQAVLAAMQFPGLGGTPVAHVQLDPTETFDDVLVVRDAGPRIELHWAPSETDDAIAVWLPEQGVVYGGAAVPGDCIPNIGTPLRTQRFTIRWAETLDKLVALVPQVLVTEFGPVITDPAAIEARLRSTAEALRYLRREVVERLERGMSEMEILADMTYPDELFAPVWMAPLYGSPDYIVRDLVREESGWWDRNPTTLHPSPPDEVARARWKALADPERVLADAEAHADAGDVQMALHVIDLVALGPDDEALVQEARRRKAEWCRSRADEVPPYVSKALYESSARLLERNETWKALAP